MTLFARYTADASPAVVEPTWSDQANSAATDPTGSSTLEMPGAVAPTAPVTPYPHSPDPGASPCPRCHDPGRWLDGYGGWHCVRCDPPVALGQVRRVEALGRAGPGGMLAAAKSTVPGVEAYAPGGPLGWWDVTELFERREVWERVWPGLVRERSGPAGKEFSVAEFYERLGFEEPTDAE